MNPRSCSGGTTPTVVCGNGLCETGESTVSCPSDCKTGTGYCGDGACNNGETSGTCSGDCPTICTPSCMNKKCGDDGCQGSCGQCPSGTFCNLQFQCEMEGGCEPQCLNKQCGDDTCGSTCGTCPAPLVCNASGQCVTAGTVQPDGGSPSEADAQSYDPSCVPDCDGKVCGSNGCGGTCGKCPQGSGCNAEGLCEPGLVDPGSSPYACGPDETLMYGKCIPMQPTGGGDDGGCGIARPASALSCLVLLGLALALLRRRHRPTRV
jgi:hypothetical protein